MKNEILARAITEIDDDLLAEAREPVKKKKPNYRIMITKYAAAVAACAAEGSVSIEGSECVSKSYPAFFTALDTLNTEGENA